MSFNLPLFSTLGVVVTYNCPIECSHCMYECSSLRKEELDLTLFENILEDIVKNQQFKIISLTGGEPFGNLEYLSKILEKIKRAGLLSGIITNGYWAESLKEAVETLKELPEIDFLSISTDTFHQEFVPIRNIFHAIEACKRLKIECSVTICTEKKDRKFIRLYKQLKRKISSDNINTSILFNVGRAFDNKPKIEPDITGNSSRCYMCKFPVLFPDGTIKGCIGPIGILDNHPLVYGNVNDESFNSIIKRQYDNPYLFILLESGPNALKEKLEFSGLITGNRMSSINNCQLCYEIMKGVEMGN